MSNEATNLIERMERETGQRVDSNDGDNMAMAGLLGAMSRMMGNSPPSYTERDDVAAGVLIRHQMSPEYAREKERDNMLADLLAGGVSPDSLAGLFG